MHHCVLYIVHICSIVCFSPEQHFSKALLFLFFSDFQISLHFQNHYCTRGTVPDGVVTMLTVMAYSTLSHRLVKVCLLKIFTLNEIQTLYCIQQTCATELKPVILHACRRGETHEQTKQKPTDRQTENTQKPNKPEV